MSAKTENVLKSKLNQICCVCLSSDRIMYSMDKSDLYKQYVDITNQNFTIETLSRICWECSARLKAAVRFKTNALLTQTLMEQYLKSNKHNEMILDTSILKDNIKPTLIEKVFEPNHADYHFVYTEPVFTHITHVINVPMIKLETNEDTVKVEDENYVIQIQKYNVEVRSVEENNLGADEENNMGTDEENNMGKDEENNMGKDEEYNVGIDEEKNMGDEENNSKIDNTIKINELNECNLVDLNDESNTSSDETLIQVKDKKKKRVRKVKEVKVKIDRRKRPANEVLNTEIFEITDLSYEEQMNEIKQRQESSNYLNSVLKCEKCYKGFVDEDAFKDHMNRHTDQAGSYKCHICEIRFKKKRGLNNHVSSHVQKFSCLKCTYVTTRRHAAKMHEEYHNGTKYRCPHCSEEFSKNTTYMSHVRVKHPTDIVCELCGYCFVSAKGLIQHKKIKHRFDDNPVPLDGPECIECNVKFINIEALQRHIGLSPKHVRLMIDKKVIACPRERKKKIVKKIPTKLDNKKHRYKGPIQCEQCDMQLPDSLTYYRHFRSAHPDKNRTHYPATVKRQFMCEVCGKMFQSFATLQDHSTTHTEGKQFSCPICGKKFQRKYRLIAHGRLHVQRSRHPCTLCSSVFTTSSNLNRHMATHSGLKPHKCEICDKSFKLASEKRIHINYVHLKEPAPKKTRGKRKNKQNEPQSNETVESTESPWPKDNNSKITPILLENKSMYYH